MSEHTFRRTISDSFAPDPGGPLSINKGDRIKILGTEHGDFIATVGNIDDDFRITLTDVERLPHSAP